VKAVGYSYPWDYVGDPLAAPRAAALGVDVVALAASYHAVRAVSPLHPTRRIMEVPHSACYVPVREEAWREHRLVPSGPAWSDDNNLFASARNQLVDVGLEVDAWIVLTHNDDLGREHPDLVVRNAFGDQYSYALCPSAPDVREYCLTLVEEVLRVAECRGLVVEACGPMGLDHADVHDKSGFASWSTTARQLLSICFCQHCHRGLEAGGVEVDELARRVKSGIDGNATSVRDALGDDLVGQVASFRLSLNTQLRKELVQRVLEVKPSTTITLHASANTWATGSSPALGDAGSLAGVTTTVANCWGPSSGEYELQTLHALIEDRSRLGAYLRMDQGWSSASVVEDNIGRYVRAGMNELHLYHLGMVSRVGLEVAARVMHASSKYPTDHWVRRRPSESSEGLPR
jgi:hypothetical protein